MAELGYRLAEIFAIRPTGVPFDVLEALATPHVVAAARRATALQAELAAAVQRAAHAIDHSPALSAAQQHRLRRKLFKRAQLAEASPEPAELADYRRLLAAVAEAEARVGDVLASDYEAFRAVLYELAPLHLPDLAVIQLNSATLARMLEHRTRKDDRTLAIWLQRVCAKNDTISAYGPSAWGRVDPDEAGFRFAPRPGIARRTVWVERWVIRAVIEAINGDPEAPAKLAPVFMDNAPLATLTGDVAAWPDGPAKQRWGTVVERIAALADDFLGERDAAARQRVLERVATLLTELGIASKERTGRLYEASNPLVENCSREGDFAVGRAPVDELVRDAAPWFELFRDVASVAAERVYGGLRELYLEAPRAHGRLVLGDFLAFGRGRGLELGGNVQSKLAEEAFAEVRTGFARRLADRADAPAWELTEDECRFLRTPAGPRPDLAYPSADLQIAASSPEAVARGDFEWVIAELHHELSLMGQSLAWSCPDRSRLAARLQDAHLHQPTVFYDSAGALHAPVHVSNEASVDGLGAVSVATDHRTKPRWNVYTPAHVVVELDEERRDLRLRCLATGTDLGTMFPLPRFFFGMHPFFPLQLEHHTPRLRRGRTILQRRGWVITNADLGGPFAELSPQLVIAIERMRAARGVPRWVFMRLRSDVLSGADAMGRRKDAKPICIDLESYVFMEIFARRLQKYAAVELVEMVPSPEQLLWREADGRRCFELRTLLVPA